MYLDRSYKPRRRRRRFPIWPFVLLAIVAIVLYEQQPRWLVPQPAEATPIPTRSVASFMADAQLLLADHRYEETLDAYREMERLEPDNPAPLVAQAELYLLLQDLSKADLLARKAVELAPDDPHALTVLARITDWVGEDYEAALNYALDALEIEPESASTLAVLGEIYTDVGNWDVAEGYIEQALELEPENILALRNQAYLYERRGDYDAAVVAYDAAIDAAPDRFDLYIERGRQYRVGLLEYEKANDSYRQAVETYESALTLDALGFGLYNVGDHLQAVRVLRQAVELDPDYGPALAHLGMALYARRNYEDAVLSLEKGILIMGESARVEHIYTLGLAFIFKDPPECDKAELWLNVALDIEPEIGPALEGLELCR